MFLMISYHRDINFAITRLKSNFSGKPTAIYSRRGSLRCLTVTATERRRNFYHRQMHFTYYIAVLKHFNNHENTVFACGMDILYACLDCGRTIQMRC